MKFRLPVFSCVLAMAMCLMAQGNNKSVVVVNIKGVERVPVSVETAGGSAAADAFNASLKRNLAISGYFELRASGGAVRITGNPGALVSAAGVGPNKMTVKTNKAFADAKAARMAAREFVDAIVNVQTGAKGFACERIVFADRKGKDNGELYTCYPDGYDIRQLTQDRHAVVGPRWAPNKEDIYYTGFLQKTPLVYRISSSTGKRELLASFKGLATGAAIAPDGKRCAIILSFQGNPELYVLNFATKRVKRMTKTQNASEASPCWSPDGRQIAYVSDTTRHPQIYLLDVATKQSRRITNAGGENTNPDWSLDGRLAWATKRGGLNYVAVMDPSKGESTARLVTDGGNWEHPSWAADGRHLIASRDKALFIIDTDPEGDKPVQIFRNQGNWMNPAWAR